MKVYQPQQQNLYNMLCELFQLSSSKSEKIIYNARTFPGIQKTENLIAKTNENLGVKTEKKTLSFELDVWIPSLKLGFEMQVCGCVGVWVGRMWRHADLIWRESPLATLLGIARQKNGRVDG